MAIPLFGPRFRWLTNIADGALTPLAFGFVYAYEAGTSTPKDTYTNSVGDVANTNPVELDTEGYADIFLGSGSYKIDIKDSAGVSLPGFPVDNIEGTVDLITSITAHSTTAVSIGTGTKTFTIEAGKSLPVNSFVLMSNDDDPTEYMVGQVTDYTGTTLEVDSTVYNGSGTEDTWTISLSGPPGPEGDPGLTGGGTGDMLGANNLSDVVSAATSRQNLGLGTAATKDTGTSAGQVPVMVTGDKYPAADGSLITDLNASELTSGTVPVARLGSGSGGAGDKFLADDGTWKAITASTTAGAIGSFIMAYSNTTKTFGQTISGSALVYAGVGINGSNQAFLEDSTAPSGTWQCLGDGFHSGSIDTVTLWQRTA